MAQGHGGVLHVLVYPADALLHCTPPTRARTPVGGQLSKRLARWTVLDGRLLSARGAAPRGCRRTLLVELCNDLRPAQLALAGRLCGRSGLRLAGRLLADRRQGAPRVLPPRWHRSASRCGAPSARAARGAAAARLCYGVYQLAALAALRSQVARRGQGMHSTSARTVLTKAHVHSSISACACASLSKRNRASNTCSSVSFKSVREAKALLLGPGLQGDSAQRAQARQWSLSGSAGHPSIRRQHAQPHSGTVSAAGGLDGGAVSCGHLEGELGRRGASRHTIHRELLCQALCLTELSHYKRTGVRSCRSLCSSRWPPAR